ncbi:MAG: hypothetical protein ACXV74_04545 [Methylobacter sp.]
MNRKFSKKLLGIITGIISLLLVSATPQAAPGNGGKPVDAGYTADLPAGFFNPTNCPFPIRVTVTGNAKSINLPGNGFIITAAPQQQAVITNLDDPTKTVSLNVQGAFHQSINDVGDNVTVITGRNLAGDPNAGLVLTIGTFSYIFDSTNTILVQPLAGQGKLINVCELIS